MEINIMQIVRLYIEANRLSKASLARSLGMTPKALGLRLSRDFVDAAFLVKLSKVCNNDFFNDVSMLMGMHKTDERILELEKEIEILNREKELLKELLKK